MAIHLSSFGSFFVVFFALAIAVFCDEQPSQRNITITYNDGCNIPECNGTVNANGTVNNLVHFAAKGDADTIHFVWSSIGAPTLLMVRARHEAQLNVDWESITQMNNDTTAITFEPPSAVLSSSAYVMGRLLEYNDTKDTADITGATEITEIQIYDLLWSNITINEANNTAIFSTVLGTYPAGLNGKISLEIQTLGTEGRSDQLPHLQHLLNTTEFSLVLDNLTCDYQHTRYAVEVLLVGDRLKGADGSGFSELQKIETIDDEYTPSVFYTYQVQIDKGSDTSLGDFIQWKPIVYTSADRNTGNSKPARVKVLNTTKNFIPRYSLAHAYYGDITGNELGSFNVTFGITDDHYYNMAKYYSWSSVVGYGDPPKEGLSTLIIILISVGLGLPVIIMIFGGVYVGVKKVKARRAENSLTTYTSING